MCILCDQGTPQDHAGGRRNFLKTSVAGLSAGGAGLFTSTTMTGRQKTQAGGDAAT